MARKSRFDGKTIVVTGASSGIGRASALAFAREGATTVLASRSEDKLGQVTWEQRGMRDPKFEASQDSLTCKLAMR